MDGRDPFRDLIALQDRMREIIDESIEAREKERFPRAWSPRVDVFETDDHLHLWVEASGVLKEDLHISADGNSLTITGETRLAPGIQREQYRLVERHIGPFSRSFSLPVGVDTSQIRASFRDGILQIRIARSSSGRARDIQIESD